MLKYRPSHSLSVGGCCLNTELSIVWFHMHWIRKGGGKVMILVKINSAI
jgi:hypothetical protein